MSKELSVHDKAILNCIFNPTLPLGEVLDTTVCEDDLKDIDDNVPESIRNKEIEAICKAELKEYATALTLLNECIAKMPQKASFYNNRAQIYLFMNNIEGAFNDVTKAIELSDAKHNRTLCEALCQRAILHRKLNRDDEAKNDFSRAANLGSMFAKSQLVALNPYAALCNQMLKKAFDDLK